MPVGPRTDYPHTRLLFRMSEDEAGSFHVEAAVIDAAGEPVGTCRTADLTRADLPEPPDLTARSADGAAFMEYGRKLFHLLCRGDLKNAWTEAERAPVDGIALDIRSATLAEFPWELLRTDEATWAFCSATRPAVRTRIPFDRPRPPELPVPAHVLVIVGDPKDTALQPEREVAAIYRGLCHSPCWQVDVLRGPTRDEFHRRCAELQPQVIHFVGHGTTLAGTPALEVRPAAAEAWKLAATTVSEAFEEHPPRLVVLNACRSAEPTAPAPFARGVCAAFAAIGCAGVVAMQGDVASTPAVHFAERLYRELGAGTPLDTAAARARVAMKNSDGVDRAGWALPVIEVATHPVDVLHRDQPVDPRQFISSYPELDRISRQVDRTTDRIALGRRLRAATSGANPAGLLFVTGAELVGKSQLLRSCATIQALSGQPTVYVSLEKRGNVSAIDFVRTVVKESKRWLRHVKHSAWLCDETLKVLPPGPGEPAPDLPPRDDTPQLFGRPRTVPNLDEFGYDRLQGLLRGLAEREPLILILDEVGELDYREAFKNGLLKPAARGDLTRVHVVLAGRRQSVMDLVKDFLSPGLEVQVGAFPARHAVHLAREYVARERGALPNPAETDEARWADFEERLVAWAKGVAAEPGDNALLPGMLEQAAQDCRSKARLS